jgi:hypothetical protein
LNIISGVKFINNLTPDSQLSSRARVINHQNLNLFSLIIGRSPKKSLLEFGSAFSNELLFKRFLLSVGRIRSA